MSYLSSLTSNPIIVYISNGDFAGLAIYILSLLLAMCLAVSFHEWAHAFVAFKLGDPTAKNMGRMTIDPTKHFTPLGLICFLFFRIGFAKPVMVNPRNLKHYRRDDALISIAGPIMNLLLAFVSYGILYYLLALKYGVPKEQLTQATLDFAARSSQMQAPYYLPCILALIFNLNISFAIFNILPIPPLDGFHVVTSIFVRKSYNVVNFLYKYGSIILLILIVSGVISFIMSPVLNWLNTAFGSFYGLFI